MTPQGVSRVISALEGEMQTALFIRSRKGMEATSEGRYFYEHTQELTRQLLDLQLGAAGDAGVEAEKSRPAYRLLLRRPEYPLHPFCPRIRRTLQSGDWVQESCWQWQSCIQS